MANTGLEKLTPTDSTLVYFNNFYNSNGSISYTQNEIDAVVGYFESRGFDRTASISTATVILQQAKIDGVKVFELIDTLQGMDKVQLSYIVTEILNHNRSNTSSLGYKVKTENSLSEKRNIVV